MPGNSKCFFEYLYKYIYIYVYMCVYRDKERKK